MLTFSSIDNFRYSGKSLYTLCFIHYSYCSIVLDLVSKLKSQPDIVTRLTSIDKMLSSSRIKGRPGINVVGYMYNGRKSETWDMPWIFPSVNDQYYLLTKKECIIPDIKMQLIFHSLMGVYMILFSCYLRCFQMDSYYG